ncbi:TonB-dependent receptor [Pedobacter metabolipauper]|uniref:TonB-dependent receptor n=1 Tax=Pedobacter metabolipauper TaxID=425513 RepID=A0A4V3D0X5_9SPHI|nr:TonB-dependent receptor [Pedobacter metabolipauper]TDQ08204.1 TonB-dependent receptor [Pedobacter metabolipauper]
MKKINEAGSLMKIIMRTSLIVSIASLLFLNLVHASSVKGQSGLDQKIDIRLQHVPFTTFLKEIEKKTGVNFVYTNKEAIGSLISVDDKSKTARMVLNPFLLKNNLSLIENGMVVVLKKNLNVQVKAKPGSVVGYIKDNESNQTLPYATIIIKSTNQKILTDVNGYFVINNLPAGNVVLQVSYIGYTASEFTVKVEDGETARTELKLKSQSNDMKGISITGIRRGEAIALSNMRNADNIKYVLSEEQIERFPDATVGEAMQRVPGIAMDYSYGLPRNIIIRGLDQSMGSVTLNGNRLPSTQTNSRDIDLNGILSSTVEAIEVNKTLTPDMEADGTSGSVNIISKTPKAGYQQFQVKGSFGNNFLLGKQNFDGSFNYGKRDNKWAYLIGANYSNTFRGEDRVQKDYDTYEIDGADKVMLSNLELEGTDLHRENLGLQAELSFFPTEKSQLYFRSAYNKFYELQTRGTKSYSIGDYTNASQVTGVNIGSAGSPRDYHRDLISFSLGAKTNVNNWKADVDVTFASGLYDQPIYYDGYFTYSGLTAGLDISDPRAPQFNFTSGDVNNPDNFRTSSYVNRHQIAHDKDLQGSFNVQRVFNLSQKNKFMFKFGGRYKYKEDDHTRDYFQYTLKTGNVSMANFLSDYSRKKYFNGKYDLSGAIANGYLMEEYYQQNLGLFQSDETYIRQNTDPDSYNGTETMGAGYVMGKLTLDKLDIITGLRYERTGFNYNGNIVNFDNQGKYLSTNKVDTKSTFDGFFPSLNLKYALDSKTNLRAAVTRSLSRPGYYDLVPWQEVEPRRKRMKKGNPDLNQATSTNFDFLFEHYLKSLGLISGGVFYKNIDDYIYESIYTQQGGEFDQYQVTQTVNGANAHVYGYEIAWQQQLTFLPGFLNGLGIYGNFTQIQSKFKVPGIVSERTVRLPSMRPKVGNASLSYEKYGFSGRFSVNFYETFISELAEEQANDLMEKGRIQLDFSASQKINKKVTLFMGISNINNAQTILDYGDGRPNDHKYFSAWANVGFKYTPF